MWHCTVNERVHFMEKNKKFKVWVHFLLLKHLTSEMFLRNPLFYLWFENFLGSSVVIEVYRSRRSRPNSGTGHTWIRTSTSWNMYFPTDHQKCVLFTNQVKRYLYNIRRSARKVWNVWCQRSGARLAEKSIITNNWFVFRLVLIYNKTCLLRITVLNLSKDLVSLIQHQMYFLMKNVLIQRNYKMTKYVTKNIILKDECGYQWLSEFCYFCYDLLLITICVVP